MLARSLALFALVTSAATPAHADRLLVTATSPGLQPGASVTIPVARFDPALGQLGLVRVTMALRPYGSVGLENTSATPFDNTLGWYTPYWNTLAAGFRVSGFPASAGSNVGYAPPTMLLGPYDGTTDFAGTSGATHTTAGNGTEGNDGMLPFTQPNAFDAFAGSGAIGVEVGPLFHDSHWKYSPPAGLVTQSTGWYADVEVRVEYVYVPHPTALCSPPPFSFACPCDAGASGAGCANSVNAAGALLVTSGTPSLANDTLTLAGTRMTNSNALYFQGTAFQHAPSVYGDGLRCVVGTIVRLGTRTNVAGASSLPSPGGTPISVVGGVTAPGTRYYQIVYRDNGAFCTPSSFNAANGVSVVWGA